MMELFKSLKPVKDAEEKIEIPKAPVFHSIDYQLATILEKISNIDNLDENEIKTIIVRQHTMILNYDLFLSTKESRELAQKLFTNKRFLSIFLSIGGLIQLNEHEVVCINKLAYDYYITENKDLEVAELLLQICYQVNNILVLKLSAYLGMNGARVLSMISCSSFRDWKRVLRVHTFLVKFESELSVQTMVDIICTIFGNRFTPAFIGMMLETKPSTLTPTQSVQFDNITCAIITILDSLTSQNIKIVLQNYAYTLKLKRKGISDVRLPLRLLVNFTRIQAVIDEIEFENTGLSIP